MKNPTKAQIARFIAALQVNDLTGVVLLATTKDTVRIHAQSDGNDLVTMAVRLLLELPRELFLIAVTRAMVESKEQQKTAVVIKENTKKAKAPRTNKDKK